MHIQLCFSKQSFDTYNNYWFTYTKTVCTYLGNGFLYSVMVSGVIIVTGHYYTSPKVGSNHNAHVYSESLPGYLLNWSLSQSV